MPDGIRQGEEQRGDVSGTRSAHTKGLAPLQPQPAGREGQRCRGAGVRIRRPNVIPQTFPAPSLASPSCLRPWCLPRHGVRLPGRQRPGCARMGTQPCDSTAVTPGAPHCSKMSPLHTPGCLRPCPHGSAAWDSHLQHSGAQRVTGQWQRPHSSPLGSRSHRVTAQGYFYPLGHSRFLIAAIRAS